MSSQLIITITLLTALIIVVMLFFASMIHSFQTSTRYTGSLMLGLLSTALRDVKAICPASPIVMPGYGTRPEASTEVGQCLHAFNTYLKIWYVTMDALCTIGRALKPNIKVDIRYHGLVLAKPENSDAPLAPVGYQFDVTMDIGGVVHHHYPIIANDQLDDVARTLVYHGLVLDNLVEHMVTPFQK